VPRTAAEKAEQRALLQYFRPENRDKVRAALKRAGRADLIGNGPNCLVSAECVKRPATPTQRQKKVPQKKNCGRR